MMDEFEDDSLDDEPEFEAFMVGGEKVSVSAMYDPLNKQPGWRYCRFEFESGGRFDHPFVSIDADVHESPAVPPQGCEVLFDALLMWGEQQHRLLLDADAGEGWVVSGGRSTSAEYEIFLERVVGGTENLMFLMSFARYAVASTEFIESQFDSIIRGELETFRGFGEADI